MAKTIKDYKDYITIAGFLITFAALLISWSNARTQRALTDDQVNRNKVIIIELKAELKQANIEVLNYRLGEIETKVGVIYTYIMKQ